MAHAKTPKSSELKALVCARFRAAGEAYISTQRKLAALLEIDPRQLNGYYNGKNYPDEALLVRFCDLTGCTMDWIFRGRLDSALPAVTAAYIGLNAPELIEPRLQVRELPEVSSDTATASRYDRQVSPVS